ncbi:hypothetical protein D3C77_296590 [compost metagenome]
MHMPQQIGRQAKAAERELVTAHLHINVHGHRHWRLALFGLMTNDHRVIRHLDRRRRQLTYGDLALGHQHLARHCKFVFNHADLEVGCYLQVCIGLDSDRQTLPLQLQIDRQGLPPADPPAQAALAGFATFPGAIELHLFASDQCLQVQVLQADRELCTGDFTTGQVQAAVDLRRQQGARQLSATVQLTGQTLDHRRKWARDGHIQPGQAEIAAQWFVAGDRIEPGNQGQFAQTLAFEIQTGIDSAGCQGALQAKGLVRKIQPLVLLAQAQGATTGVNDNGALGTAGRHIQIDVGIEQALPGEVFGQPLRQTLQRELFQVIAQTRLRGQALVFTAQAGLPRAPTMGTEIQLPAGQALEFCRCLQLPVLTAGLDLAAGKSPTPVTFVQLSIQRQIEFELRPIQGHFQLLLAYVTAALGVEHAQAGITQTNAARLQFDQRTLGGIQPGVQRQALQVIVRLGQLLPLQRQSALGCLQGSRNFQPAFYLALQLRPELAKTWQVEIELTGQALLQAAATVDPVVAQADIQRAKGPVLPRALGDSFKYSGLSTQAPVEVKRRIQTELTLFNLALATQRASQGAGQLGEPVSRVQRRKFKGCIPGHSIGKLHTDTTGDLALSGIECQLRQGDLLQVALERTAQVECSCRSIQSPLELTLIAAIAVLHLAVETAQCHLRRWFQRVQMQPGEVQPVDSCLGAQALLPVGLGREFEVLIGAGSEIQSAQLRALGIDLALQSQCNRVLFGWQAG